MQKILNIANQIIVQECMLLKAKTYSITFMAVAIKTKHLRKSQMAILTLTIDSTALPTSAGYEGFH